MHETYLGMPVHISDQAYIRRQFRFPKTKRKRIRKKFRVNQENWKTEYQCYIFDPAAAGMPGGKRMVVHPEMYAQIKKIQEF